MLEKPTIQVPLISALLIQVLGPVGLHEDPIIQLSLISLFVPLSAAVSVALVFRRSLSGYYLLRVAVSSVGVAVGVFITAFVVSGYGWGWMDLSRGRELLFRVTAGLCIGFFYAAFGWIVSGRMRPLFVTSLVAANLAVPLLLSPSPILGLAAYALVNFLLLSIWLAKAGPRHAVR